MALELDLVQSDSFNPKLTSIWNDGGSWGPVKGPGLLDDCPFNEPMDRNAFNRLPPGNDLSSGNDWEDCDDPFHLVRNPLEGFLLLCSAFPSGIDGLEPPAPNVLRLSKRPSKSLRSSYSLKTDPMLGRGMDSDCKGWISDVDRGEEVRLSGK